MRVTVGTLTALTFLFGTACSPSVSTPGNEPLLSAIGPGENSQRLERAMDGGFVPDGRASETSGLIVAANSEEYFHFIDDLTRLSEIDSHPAREKLGRVALGALRTWFTKPQLAENFGLNSSPFVELALGQFGNQAVTMVDSSLKDVDQKVRAAAANLPTANAFAGLATPEILNLDLTGLHRFLADLRKSNAGDSVVQPFNELLSREIEPAARQVLGIWPSLVGSIRQESLSSTLARFSQLLGGLSFIDDADKKSGLQQISGVTQAVVRAESIKSSETGLMALIELWHIIPAENREATFKKAQPQLFAVFNGWNEEDFTWVQDHLCSFSVVHPIRGAINKVICSKLDDLGPVALREQLVEGIRGALVEELTTGLRTVSAGLPEKIIGAFSVKIEPQLEHMRTQPGRELRSLVGQILKDNIFGSMVSIPAIPARSMCARLDRDQGLDLSTCGSRASSPAVMGAGGLGAAISSTLRTLEMARQRAWISASALEFRQHVFGILNVISLITGFKSFEGNVVASLAQPLLGGRNSEPITVDHLESKVFVALPGVFSFTGDSKAGSTGAISGSQNLSAREFGETLKGLADFARFSQDWNKNGFDDSLGSVQFEGFHIFPKDTIFGLSVAALSLYLRNFQNGHLRYIDQMGAVYESEDRVPKDRSVIAVTVPNIVDGRATDYSETAGVAQVILGVDAALDALDGIERSASPVLLKEENGVRPLDQLIQIKKQLTQLLVALSNSLTGRLTQIDGGLQNRLNWGNGTSDRSPRRLDTQIAAIRALICAGLRLGAHAYIRAASDALGFVHTKLTNGKEGRYILSEGSRILVNRPSWIAQVALVASELAPEVSNSTGKNLRLISQTLIDQLGGQFQVSSDR